MEEKDFRKSINEVFGCKEQDIRTYSPLALAYIGDAVFDLVIRSIVVESANRPAHELHKMSVRFVKAASQAAMADALLSLLSPEEEAVYKRGRNANPHTVAKNASRSDYRKATGFEALIGYLYLTGANDRMLELIRQGLAISELEKELPLPKDRKEE